MQTLYGWRRKFGEMEVSDATQKNAMARGQARLCREGRRALSSLQASGLSNSFSEEIKSKLKMFASKFRRFGRSRIHAEAIF